MFLKNNKMSVHIKDDGVLDMLTILDDPHQMNWVITQEYLDSVEFCSKDKLFGNFEIKVEDKVYKSINCVPSLVREKKEIAITYKFSLIDVTLVYDMTEMESMKWRIFVQNKMSIPLKIQDFFIWVSYSYSMFRDHDVKKNIFHSTSFFPSISQNYSKFALMRRSLGQSSLGMYQLKGETLSVGSYCEFQNKFLEDVSPSLDGLIYHQLNLSSEEINNDKNWLYPQKQVVIPSKSEAEWEYVILPIDNQESFYYTGKKLGHPMYEYPSSVKIGQNFEIRCKEDKKIDYVIAKCNISGDLVEKRLKNKDEFTFRTTFSNSGEHKIVIYFTDGSVDAVIINVVHDIREMIQTRVDYLCKNSYQEIAESWEHVFTPISNQGESLGKLGLILKKNLLDNPDIKQIEKVEKSIHYYVLDKWFEKGDFTKPRNLYNGFYRVMDFEYLGHVLYLLSKIPQTHLQFATQEMYLNWAAQVVELRINPEMHRSFRAKEEAEMLGVFFLYIGDLLRDLKKEQSSYGERLSLLWENNLLKILEEKGNYGAAVTEHFFDNAGFGPAAAALANSNYKEGLGVYSDLLLANIGFSNDFRMQNPDRWWEALSYMIHSLWGGISAAASLDVYLAIKDTKFLEASYRAFNGVLYCYDTNATSTTMLNKGAAASTFSCSQPHLNRLDLGHQRFGQETFAKDGGIFSQIFSEDRKQTSDWDMGEELVAYLDRFGQDSYCYFDEIGQLKLVNCSIEERDEGDIIRNDAPYPRNIYLLRNNEFIVIKEGTPISKIKE